MRAVFSMRMTHHISKAAKSDHSREDFRPPGVTENVLEEENSDQLPRVSDVFLWDCGYIGDVDQEKQSRGDPERYQAGSADSARWVSAFHLANEVERIVPPNKGVVDLHEGGR